MGNKSSSRMLPYREEHKELFKDVVYLVEASFNEIHLFWEKFHYKPMFPDFKIESWESESMSKIITIGHVDNRPIAVDISWAKLEGYRVMFYEASSQLADYAMIEEWLSHFREELPLIQSTDATNVGQCIRHCIERKKKEK